jgi:hypothetical protein
MLQENVPLFTLATMLAGGPDYEFWQANWSGAVIPVTYAGLRGAHDQKDVVRYLEGRIRLGGGL